MALSATLHCLTGCAIGEITGLMIGTAIGLSTGWTIALAVTLAFFFGYTLSTLPLLKAGVALGTALSVVLAADTLSIATMEIVDNLVMALIPGAMDAGLVNVIFWVAMMIALTVAFFAAYPVNRYLLARGKGHALTHQYHGSTGEVRGARRTSRRSRPPRWSPPSSRSCWAGWSSPPPASSATTTARRAAEPAAATPRPRSPSTGDLARRGRIRHVGHRLPK